MATSSNSSGNPLLDNPGITATVFALIVFFVFAGALYQSATSPHGDSHGAAHGGEHKAAH